MPRMAERETRHSVHAALTLLSAALTLACGAPEAHREKEPGSMRVLAGNGTEGFQDGIGSVARFRKPIRLAP